MPTSGAALYRYQGGAWVEEYAHRISPSEYARICATFDVAFERASFPRPVASWGAQLEHRDTQVTFSAFGQNAPVEEKAKWEVEGARQSKKQELVALLTPLLPEYSVKAGGMTSVDITHKGIDKQYGIEQFLKHSGHATSDVLFVGDALYEGGNDHVVTKTGVDVCAVEGPEDLLLKLSPFTV
jgi:hydroxymethylpyrimidine pyrophosphatase-like HAD family hydrolase